MLGYALYHTYTSADGDFQMGQDLRSLLGLLESLTLDANNSVEKDVLTLVGYPLLVQIGMEHAVALKSSASETIDRQFRLYSLLSVMRVHKMPSTPRVDQRIYMDAGGLKLVAAALTYLPTVQARRFSYRSLTNCEASGQPAGTYKVLPNRKGSGAGTS